MTERDPAEIDTITFSPSECCTKNTLFQFAAVIFFATIWNSAAQSQSHLFAHTNCYSITIGTMLFTFAD